MKDGSENAHTYNILIFEYYFWWMLMFKLLHMYPFTIFKQTIQCIPHVLYSTTTLHISCECFHQKHHLVILSNRWGGGGGGNYVTNLCDRGKTNRPTILIFNLCSATETYYMYFLTTVFVFEKLLISTSPLVILNSRNGHSRHDMFSRTFSTTSVGTDMSVLGDPVNWYFDLLHRGILLLIGQTRSE